MLSLSSQQIQPSALLSNARLTIATLIQRPSTVTTSNAFDEFAILDHLIDVSNDVDRFEGGESRKFLNIAQLITASTCIYSRRVDALYKLINNFQSSESPQHDESMSDDNDSPATILAPKHEENPPEKVLQAKKKKIQDTNRSFLCTDLNKISLNPSKTFFLDRTSLFDLKLFQSYVPIGNKQFWIDDNRPMVFDLLYNERDLLDIDDQPQSQEPERLIDALDQLPPVISRSTFDDNDIPLPISPTYDDQESSLNPPTMMDHARYVETKKSNRNRSKKTKTDIDLNMFRQGLTAKQQGLFRFQKLKSVTNKIKTEQTQFFQKQFNRKHFDLLIKDCSSSIFIYPVITIHHFPIRKRYSPLMRGSFSRTIRSPPLPIFDVLDENALVPLSPSSPMPLFVSEDIQEDFDVRLQTDMEHFLDAAMTQSNEEHEHNKIFLGLRSSIMSYMTEHQSIEQTNLDDLVQSLDDQYSLPLIFNQLLHLCASTQRYCLHSTANDNLFIEKIM